MIELVERYDRFLTFYAVSVLRLLGDGHQKIEPKLISVIKGTVFPVPIEILAKHLEKLTDPEMIRRKVMETLFERHQMLGDVSSFIRKEVSPEAANRPLLAHMESNEGYEKAFSLTAMSGFGHAKAQEILQISYPSFPKLLRWGIIAILESLGDWKWMPLFTASLQDSEPEIVRIAVAAIGKSGSEAASKKLLELLENQSETVVIAAIQGLSGLRDPAVIPPLCKLAETTENNKIKATIVSCLGEFQDGETLPYLLDSLGSQDSRIRANAVLSLKKRFLQSGKPDDEIIRKIKSLLTDADHRVRADVIQSLWELGRIESIGEIEEMLKSGETGSRISGAYLCGKLKLHQMKDQLVSLTDDGVWEVRKTASIALLGLGDVGVNVLRGLLAHGSPDQQVISAYAMGLADDPNGVDWLLSASRSGNELADMATDLLLRLSKPADL